MPFPFLNLLSKGVVAGSFQFLGLAAVGAFFQDLCDRDVIAIVRISLSGGKAMSVFESAITLARIDTHSLPSCSRIAIQMQ